MKLEFENRTPLAIDPNQPNIILSTVEVTGLIGRIRDVNVTLDIVHTFTEDLRISLSAPSGTRVVLVVGAGGSGNNFRRTKFDDAATQAIGGARPPFTGTFRPQESLTGLNGEEANGTWILEVADRFSLDGGTLNSWSLMIETASNLYENRTPQAINPGPPTTIQSTIEVSGLGGMVVDDLDVTVDIDHTWANDLTLILISPDKEGVVLVSRQGGSRDDFTNTKFDDEATIAINDASPPFRGRFRPSDSLARFREKLGDGIWTLEVTDHTPQDGGSLNYWSLAITAKTAETRQTQGFRIDLRFNGGLTANQRSVFELAAARWSQIITGDLPTVLVGDEVIEGILIEAQGTDIDGRGGILGQAGPTHLRPVSLLPARGLMSFDSADLARIEADGGLIRVILHEMAHVLGFGTIWGRLGLLQGAGTANPAFTGDNAMREYATLTQRFDAMHRTPVPVANTGGPGTRDGHWRESVLGNELMTGFLSTGDNPLSRLTIGGLEDLGYQVNYEAADAFDLPGNLALAEMGSGDLVEDHGGYGAMFFPDEVVLPLSALRTPS